MSIGIVCQQMGKVSVAVRSAAMSHIEPRLTTILGRVKMRRNLAKIAVVMLLLCVPSEARPRNDDKSATTKPIADRRKAAVSTSAAATNIQDSRYTWNSGSSRVPYARVYRDRVDRSVTGADAEVSIDAFDRSAACRDVGESKNSSNYSVLAKDPTRTNRRTSKKIDGERSFRPFKRGGGSVSRNFASKSDHDRSLGSKIPRVDGALEIVSNDSPKGLTRVRDSGFSSVSDSRRLGVDPSIEFDHVAAIEKITDALARRNVVAASSEETATGRPVGQFVSPASVSNSSNRRSTSKHSNSRNKTKARPPSTWNKKIPGKSKIPNKTNSSQPLNWKNWPNGAIQSASDYQNYEKYTSSMEHSKPETLAQKPVVPQTVPQTFPLHVPQTINGVQHLVPVSSSDLQEIVHWLKIPAFAPNGSHILESNESNDPISVAFHPVYQNLQPNRPPRPPRPSKPSRPTRPNDLQSFGPGSIQALGLRPVYTTEKPFGWSGNKTQSDRLDFDHVALSDSKKPTAAGIKRPVGDGGRPVLETSGSANAAESAEIESYQLDPSAAVPKPGPNVHIGFTSYEEKDKEPPNRVEPRPPLVTYDQRCPTILINSYTRINNTVQSKEGCTDLNIIINSQVFNTNTYKSTVSPPDQEDPSYGAVDKYGSGPFYRPESQYDYHGPANDPVTFASDDVEGSNLQVYQGTRISILGSGAASEAAAVEPVEQVNESSNDPDVFDASPAAEEVSEPNNESDLNSAIRPEADPVAGENSGSSLPPSIAPASSSPSPSPSPSSSLASDDDEDDDLDLSPTGIMESIASVFAYFTYVNPLHYGFFSVAAAPFTALAAGVLGMVTFFFPWLFPSSFGFGRANNDAVGLWRNVEDVIGQSMEKYGRLNEWKSRRKKRKK